MDKPIHITIATNTFGKYHRQDIAIQSLEYLRDQFPENVNVINLQFEDEATTFVDHYPTISTHFVLKTSSLDYLDEPSDGKKLPLVYEIIKQAFANCDSDYVVFTNSDIIFRPRLIEHILMHRPDCFTGPRLDILGVLKFQHVINNSMVPIRCEIAGYDFFVFKRSWFELHSHLFNCPYFMGKPLFDVVYAGLMVLFGSPDAIQNTFPVVAMHVGHGNAAVVTECPEKAHNEKMMHSDPIHLLAHNVMYYNLQFNLCSRTPWGVFTEPSHHEQTIQKNFFTAMNMYTKKEIHQPKYA